MVGGGHDYAQDQKWVADARNEEEDLRVEWLAWFASLRATENPGVVQERRPDAERVGEVQARHGCELIDVVSSNPDGFGTCLTDGILKAEFLR